MLLINIQVIYKPTNELCILAYAYRNKAIIHMVKNNKLEEITTTFSEIQECRDVICDIHRKGARFIVDGIEYTINDLNSFKIFDNNNNSYWINSAYSNRKIKDMTTLELLEVYKDYEKVSEQYSDTFLESMNYANYGNELIERWKDKEKYIKYVDDEIYSTIYCQVEFENFLYNMKNMTNEEILQHFIY